MSASSLHRESTDSLIQQANGTQPYNRKPVIIKNIIADLLKTSWSLCVFYTSLTGVHAEAKAEM